MKAATVGTYTCKAIKVVLTIIIIVLYRTGFGGSFLGVGGTWNLNEDKSPDAEILASGVFVGYLLYNIACVVSSILSQERATANEIVMNIVGVFLWVAVAGTALHYWHGYQNEHKYLIIASEREVGLALGSLCVLNAAAHLIDAVLSFKIHAESSSSY